MGKPDLIEQRQYAETIMAGLNIRPFRVDLTEGLLLVPRGPSRRCAKALQALRLAFCGGTVDVGREVLAGFRLWGLFGLGSKSPKFLQGVGYRDFPV